MGNVRSWAKLDRPIWKEEGKDLGRRGGLLFILKFVFQAEPLRPLSLLSFNQQLYGS